MNPSKLLNRLGLDYFLGALLCAAAISFVIPDLGKSRGWLHLDLYTNYGIAIVFLLYGLTLPWDRLKAGMLNWRLHLLVLSSTFLLFPLIVEAAEALIGAHIGPDIKLGYFYLAASPSTVSSSVAMTSIAGGNIAGAVFNASLSSLVGVVVTPLWVNWYLARAGVAFDLGGVILKICLLVLAPIVLGQVLRPFLSGWMSRHIWVARLGDRGTILAIVLNSLSDSVAQGIWRGQGITLLGEIAACDMILFFSVFLSLLLICRPLGFNRADTIAGVFCGTKKSFASGVSMAPLMFGKTASLGMIILPFIIYHLLQLVSASLIARRWGRNIPTP